MKQHPSRTYRAAAIVLVPAQVLLAVPVAAQAPEPSEPARLEAPAVKPRKTLPPTRPAPLVPEFSAFPSEGEILRARVFDEPLVPMGKATTPAENRAIADAILAYLSVGDAEATRPFQEFLAAHPHSAWRGALLTNLGIVYRRTGYYSRALATWEQAWAGAKHETEPRAKAIADRALAELTELTARLGRFDRLERLFAEIEGRDVQGSATEKIAGARAGYWLMKNRPDQAFRCGPMALDRILAATRADYSLDPRIVESRSTERGTSLVQMRELARELGMPMRMARRAEPHAAPLVPAMVHWKAGHYAALVRFENGRYLAQDPTFGDETWLTRAALDEESSGYFLVRGGELPAGWEAVDEAQGAKVWGRGNTGSNDTKAQTKDDPTKGCSCQDGTCRGMASYDVHLMLVNLTITDTPVGYSPPRGPGVQFTVTYNQREAFQPQVPYYSNLGPKWTYGFLSWVEDNPSNLAADVNVYRRGGGLETLTGYDAGTQSYAPAMRSRAVVVRTSSSPVRYERRLPDGSIEVFAQPDGAASFPRRVFMTEWRDPQGNTVTFSYDSSLRLVAITDAIGQITALSYEAPLDFYKITAVTDPFGRSARFEYNASGQLSRITDVVGIESSFTYTTGDFIDSLTTPYGTTRFTTGQAGIQRWLEVTDPLGGVERVEFRHEAPGIASAEPEGSVPGGLTLANRYLQYRNTFYWDKRAMALHPGDYTKARLTHWLHMTDTTVASGVIESTKEPLENRVWRTFAGQPGPAIIGDQAQPSAVARVLDDGTSQITRYEYNRAGKVIKATDPLGRETVYVYGSSNVPDPTPATGSGLDLLQVKQKNPASAGGYDVLASTTYNAQHLPLTTTDASGQTTTYTYNAQGQVLTVVTPPRAGLSQAQRTTSYSYDADGRLLSVTGPEAGSTTTFTHDGYGRVRTVTDADGYTVTYGYDALDRVTKVSYPDGTTEETVFDRLDPERRKDRLGRWSHTVYDALRRPVSMRDPAGRTTTQEWCTCGSLDRLIDPNGNPTSWQRDLQGRVTRETRANGSYKSFVYENTTSRLKQTTDAKGQTATYGYFRDDALASITYTNAQFPTPNVSFTYDANYSRLLGMTDGTGTTSYGYHPVAQPPALGAARLASVDGPLAGDTVGYSYDELGRVQTRSVNGAANTQTMAFDSLGRVTTITNLLGAFSYAYDGVTARLATVTYPNGQTSSYAYETNLGDHRLREIHHRLSGGATLSKFDYTTDAVGNIRSWQQQYGSDPAKVYDLGYDSADQLTRAVLKTTDPTPAVVKRYGYDYDKAGNRTTEQIDDAATASLHDNMNRLTSQQAGGALLFEGTLSEPATVSVQGQAASVAADNTFRGKAQAGAGTTTVLVQATDPSGNVRTNTYEVTQAGTPRSFSYDANGNLTSDATRSFEWDAENRLLRVCTGACGAGSDPANMLARFVYDGQGRRYQKVSGGITRTYVLDGDHVAEERLSGAQTGTIRYFHGPGIDDWLGRQETDASATFFVADHLDSIARHTNAAGTVTLTRTYDVWGNLDATSATVSGPAFTGREWDAETGLAYYRARWYEPRLGRFASEDLIGFEGGWNLYAYVLGQPTNLIDPYGLEGTTSWQVHCRQACAEQPPPDRPDWACVQRDMRQARDFNAFDFYFHVRNSGPWDYKQHSRRFEDYGNFNYGATCYAAGFPKFVCKKAAGYAHQRAQGRSIPRAAAAAAGPPPHGDDWRDQRQAEHGWNWAAARRACGCEP